MPLKYLWTRSSKDFNRKIILSGEVEMTSDHIQKTIIVKRKLFLKPCHFNEFHVIYYLSFVVCVCFCSNGTSKSKSAKRAKNQDRVAMKRYCFFPLLIQNNCSCIQNALHSLQTKNRHIEVCRTRTYESKGSIEKHLERIG